MKQAITVLFIILLIFSGCTNIYEDEYDPYIGIYHLISPLPFDSYDCRPINEYSNERDLLFCVSDPRAISKGKSGENLEFTIFTSSGESETLNLDGTDIVGFDRAADSPGYHYFKRIFPKSYPTPTPGNEVIEINNLIDTIYFQYKSASFPKRIITDTLLYKSYLLDD